MLQTTEVEYSNAAGTELSEDARLERQVKCCVICREPESAQETLATVGKGQDKILQYGKTLDDEVTIKLVLESQSSGRPLYIHRQCQKSIYNAMKRKSGSPVPSDVKIPRIATTRSEILTFNWKSDCFICGNQCKKSDRPDRIDCRQVQVLEMRRTMLDICASRDAELSSDVQRRLLASNDLVAVEAKYHIKCRENFKKISPHFTPGRPLDQRKETSFERLCEWLESEVEVYLLAEIHQKMTELSQHSNDVYSQKWLKSKLKMKYGPHVRFAESAGKSNMVCFDNLADLLITDQWYQERKSTAQDEAQRIIIMAGKLIREDIRSKSYSCDSYPSKDEIENVDHGWLPSLLLLLLKEVIKSPLKQGSIGQSLIYACRPRSSIPPILFGLGVEADHLFGSRWLINQLSKLGYSVSVDEVTRFKQSVVENDNMSLEIGKIDGSFTQWSADNIDHNLQTIDGKGSFHGMGIVSSTTNYCGPCYPSESQPIKRQKLKKVKDMVKKKGIEIKNYSPSETPGLSKLLLKPINDLPVPYQLSPDVGLNLLWHALSFFKDSGTRPGWSGYMTNVSRGQYPGKSTISMLPIIDLDPTDMSCIFSTLLFVIKQAKLLEIVTPVLTFDQPLWLKANEIVQSTGMDIVLVLGGFHTMMSFMGSIGNLMDGSGLREVLCTVYGPNAVEHMFSGKAVSRALRGHFLVSSALTTKILSKILPSPGLGNNKNDQINESETSFSEQVDESDDTSVLSHRNLSAQETLQEECDELSYQTVSLETVDGLRLLAEKIEIDPECAKQLLQTSEELITLENLKQSVTSYLKNKTRTAKFWIQYLDYIDVLKLFIMAERTGNWSMHLSALQKMLNLFAATGHTNYAKSARLHLQQMLELETKHPWVHMNFMDRGFHTVRRSDRYWAGLWSDLIIEQVLMRALKTRGGLTRGRGVTESVRLLWVYTMHRSAEVHNAMTNLTGLLHSTSEQHVELGASRIKKDNADLQKFMEWFELHDPFTTEDPSLHSLSSGLTDLGTVLNCDKAEDVGSSLQQHLDGLSMHQAKLRRKDQVKTLASLRPGLTLEEKTVSIDPLILFCRLTSIMQQEGCVAKHFKYELTPEPTALFKDGLMRKPNKSALRNLLLDQVIAETTQLQNGCCVADGGALLYKVKWLMDSTFEDICSSYVDYVTQRYGRHGKVSVVFDGYHDKMSIKGNEHTRRGSKSLSASITMDKAIVLSTSREMFLNNVDNKVRFIKILTTYLTSAGIEVVQSSGDADVLIVKTALEKAKSHDVVVSAQDTDILILLVHHWSPELKEIYYETEWRENSATVLKKWRVSRVIQSQELVDYLLFAHAWTGSDSTSAIHRQGKKKILQLLQSQKVKDIVQCFGDLQSTQECIGEAGVKLAIASYGGQGNESMARLRYYKFMESVTTCASLHPENLPATDRAIHFHALRVHLQLCQWKMLDLNCLNPMEWGWHKGPNCLKPVKTDLAPAPEFLLKFIRCKCSTNRKNTCGTNMCTCRRNGLKCVAACGDCHGEECCNAAEVDIEDIDIDGDNDSSCSADFDRNIFDIFMD